jgi:hypothetical protein
VNNADQNTFWHLKQEIKIFFTPTSSSAPQEMNFHDFTSNPIDTAMFNFGEKFIHPANKIFLLNSRKNFSC